jgi:TP901 family phage tail tape measure protein
VPIGRLFFEISADSSKLNEGLRQATKSLENVGLQATRAGQSLISRFDEALNPTKKLAEQIELLSAAGKTDAEIMKVLGSAIEQASKQARAMGQPIDDLVRRYTSLESRMKTAGESFTGFGRGMSMYVTAPIVAAATAATKYAVDFNRSMAEVATLIPKSSDRINELKRSVQDMAIATGKSTEDLAGGLYQVISAFGDSADTAKILDINARAAAAGMSTTTDAINLTSAVTKGYGDASAAAVQKASDLAFVTVKLGQTTFPELAASMGSVIPVAAKMGVAQEELFAGMATLTGVTGNASEVSTQLAAILRAMIKPTDDMAKAIKTLGYSSSEALVSDKGMVGALKALIRTTDGSTESVGKLFGRAEALTSVFALTGGQAEVFNEKLDAIRKSAGSTDEAFAETTCIIGAFRHTPKFLS